LAEIDRGAAPSVAGYPQWAAQLYSRKSSVFSVRGEEGRISLRFAVRKLDALSRTSLRKLYGYHNNMGGSLLLEATVPLSAM
jgi:hypothetical protein